MIYKIHFVLSLITPLVCILTHHIWHLTTPASHTRTFFFHPDENHFCKKDGTSVCAAASLICRVIFIKNPLCCRNNKIAIKSTIHHSIICLNLKGKKSVCLVAVYYGVPYICSINVYYMFVVCMYVCMFMYNTQHKLTRLFGSFFCVRSPSPPTQVSCGQMLNLSCHEAIYMSRKYQ